VWCIIVGVYPPAALAWPPCSRSCLQWPLWSPSGFANPRTGIERRTRKGPNPFESGPYFAS
jgi:hypothetical protein